MEKREIAPEEQFLLFSTLFYICIVKLHIHLLNAVVQFIVFLTLSTLICRGTDISSVSVSPLEFEITRVDCRLILPRFVVLLLLPGDVSVKLLSE